MSKIFESPDGGKTVYQREFGARERTLVPVREHQVGMEEYGGIWKEVVGFPDWELIKKHHDVRDAYEKFLLIQEEYKVLDQLAND